MCGRDPERVCNGKIAVLSDGERCKASAPPSSRPCPDPGGRHSWAELYLQGEPHCLKGCRTQRTFSVPVTSRKKSSIASTICDRPGSSIG